MLKHYVHCHQPFDLNKGGSVGYISTLFESYRRFGIKTTKNGVGVNFLFPNIENNERIFNRVLADYADDKFKYIDNFENRDGLQNLINERKRWFREVLPKSESAKIDWRHIGSVHIHGAYNFLPIYNELIRNGRDDVIKILTTHNPYKPELEDMELISRGRTWKEADIRTLKYFYNERDKAAFGLCDALIFHSEYSMEGYYKYWPEFEQIIKNKRIYFCTTSGQRKQSNISKELLRSVYGIEKDAKVFLYLGRFVNVRGYDILIKAAREILSRDNNIYFLVVGESSKTSEIVSDRWIQIPFTTIPGNFLSAADACICPNRGSLFDLSMVEVMASGCPLICSKVGGYKYLENRTSGVFYIEPENVDQLISTILCFTSKTNNEIEEYKKDNIKLYDNDFDLKYFNQRYSNVIDQIYSDFNVQDCFTIKSNVKQFEFDKNQGKYTENEFVVTKPVSDVLLKQTMPTKKEAKISANKPIQATISKTNTLSEKERKLRKLKRTPYLYFRDFFLKKKNSFIYAVKKMMKH